MTRIRRSEIVEPNVIFAQTHEDQETVAYVQEIRALAIPVVDNLAQACGYSNG